jgi:ATP-dependent DNA helicase RecG
MFWRLLILAEKSRRDSKTPPREPAVDPLESEKFLSLLPFKLTPEQIRVSEEFTADLRSAKPLNRLLQGEVGSGKTVVAGLVASVILARGKQVAFLAPTEFLARRYFEFLSPLMEKLGRVPALLIGSLSLKEKRRVLKGLSDGAINLAIGDQTLLPAIRSRADLGLAIIDERERFGVRQRLALTREYPGLDLMSLSAPIPRSLAPILYGDMDISSIHDPSHGSSHNSSQGQKTPETIVYQEYDSAKAYEKFFAAIRRGQPGVALCPRLGYDAPLDDPGLDPLAPEPAREEDAREEEDLLFQLAMPKEIKPRPGLDILAIEKLIRAKAPDLRLGVIHGRQEPALRHKTLKAFEAGRLDILAATSIIEVGVDTPSANITLVEGADIFGLSKLHQLRSQVGRGGGQGLFLAISSYKATDIAGERLEALTRYADGFKLAEMDMKIRGPGEEVELKASGWPIFKFAKFPRDLAFWPKALELADNLWPRLGQWPDLAARIDLLAKELASWPETKTS